MSLLSFQTLCKATRTNDITKMKLFKLIVHQKNFSGEDLIINSKDNPGIQKGDVVEIYHPEDEFSRLLLQVTAFKEDLQGRETISVENNVATMFQLRTFADVHMNIVNPNDVALDSIELTFKDQYMGRSEMWRLKNSLVSCSRSSDLQNMVGFFARTFRER